MKYVWCFVLLFPLFILAQDSKPDWPNWNELGKTVSVEKDIVYAEVDGRKLRFDLYRPSSAKEKVLPGILFIHGGAWSKGNKKSNWRQSAMLAREGYAVACIEYRLLPDATIFNCVQDAKAAVRFLRAEAKRYKVDPDRIGAIGGSAGGHLTGMLATSCGAKDLDSAGGHREISSCVQAAVPMAMPSDLDNQWTRKAFKMSSEQARKVSPRRYASGTQPPILLLHCKADKTVPYFSSSAFQLVCKGKKADCRLVDIKTGGHAFWHNPRGFEETMKAALPFFEKHLKVEESL